MTSRFLFIFVQVCNIFAVHISEMDWNAMYHCHPCLFFFCFVVPVGPVFFWCVWKVDSSHRYLKKTYDCLIFGEL